MYRTFLLAISNSNGSAACAQLNDEGKAALAERVANAAPANAAPETAGSDCPGYVLLLAGAYGNAIRNPKLTALRSAAARRAADLPMESVELGG